jgi:protein TonB
MPLRCLVFSSNEEMVKPIWPVLTDLGIEGEYCGSAVDAVEKVTTQLFQIVITDWEDQPEAAFLLKTAREQKAAQRPLTLAIVNDDARLPEALQAGANSVLLKPIRLEQVRDTMSTACELLRAKQTSAAPKAGISVSAVPPKLAMAAAAPAAAPIRPSPTPPSIARERENSFRPGEFLSSASTAPGTHFDTECDVQKSLDQASATEVDALTELEPIPSAVASEPAAEPAESPTALTGWASLQERLMKSAPQKVREASSNNELLAYGETPSQGLPSAKQAETEIPVAKTPQAESDREAALFAYMDGEAKAEPKPADPIPPKRNKILFSAILGAACVIMAAIPQTRQILRDGFRQATGAGKIWLNPQPAPVSQVAPQHESFGTDSDEYKLPQVGNIPDASTDSSQIHVVAVVDPTAKPVKGSETNPPGSGDAASNPGQNASNGSAASQAADAPANQSAAGSGDLPVEPVAAPVVNPPGSQAPPKQPVEQGPQPSTAAPVQSPARPPAGSSTGIPLSLRSQLASMTPEASGAKPVEAAMSSIEPVALPEQAAWSLLAQPVDPVYPDGAKAGGQHGTVVLQVLIGRDGIVQEAKFLQGSLVFARAAIDGVKQWRFKPYLLNGRPVSVLSTITLNFKPPA